MKFDEKQRSKPDCSRDQEEVVSFGKEQSKMAFLHTPVHSPNAHS